MLKYKYIKTMFACALTAVSLGSVAQVTMNIDASKRGPTISNYQYGLFFEEINHAGDGGLYAEMIRNRSFEDSSNPDYWKTISPSGTTVSQSVVATNLMNNAQARAMQLVITNASDKLMAGVYNEGFWGMGFKADSVYTFSVWVRARDTFNNKLHVQLQSSDGTPVSASTPLSGNLSIDSWNKLTATVKATATSKDGRLAILSSANGTVNIDMASLFPYTWKGRNNGCRPDLAQLLYDTKPTFMRFPGGCYVEGQDSYDNAFQWKKTIGPIETRLGHWNNNWGYRSSDGLGYDEYLQLCEDLNAIPLFVVNIGLGHGFTIPIEDIDTLVQNTLDAIEYANGDASTKWGALRIANGHTQPYNLKFLEVGNENYQVSNKDDYGKRYYEFYKAVKAKYPEIEIIGNVEAWGTDNPSWAIDYPVDIVDEHYYRTYSWMANNYNKYDRYPRTIAVYNGEYAANSGSYGKYGNLNSALGESVYMMGMERNSDVCKMASFAPIFTHEKDPRWAYDMIHFNASSVFCTPSYYVQQLMANNLGTQNLLWTESGNTVSTASKSSSVGLGSWNTAVSYDDVSVTSGDGTSIVSDDFSGNDSKWTANGGTWTVSNGTYSEGDIAESCISINKTTISSGKYIYKLRARKNSGSEGFLVIFNYQNANNYCWWNIGGWNNTANGVEQCIDGQKTTIASASGHVDTSKWYNIEIRVDGSDVICLLDKNEVHHFTLSSQKQIYQSAQVDETNGLLYLKVTNPTSSATTLNLNLINMKADGGTVVRLVSASGTDENTMDEPTKVSPTAEATLPSVSSLDIPAYSLNVFKINVKDVAAEVSDGLLAEDADKYGYLYAHMNSSQEITNYALSRYGTVFNDLFNSGEVFDTKSYTTTGGMRDAYVCRTQNGKFMLAGTDMTSSLGWSSNHIMVFMLSNDLVHWDKEIKIDLESDENMKALGVSSPDDITAAWAPQIIFDPVTQKYMIYYSVGFNYGHRIYYSLMNEDLSGLTKPQLLFDPSYDVIDADIVYNEFDKQYVMIYKHEENTHYLLQATAKTLVPEAGATGLCQWTINPNFSVKEEGKSIEAPSLFRPIGSKTWKLAYMNYSGGGYRMVDLDEHCLNPQNLTNMAGNVQAQHGSFVKLTQVEYTYLKTWESVKTMLASAESKNASEPYAPLAAAIEKAKFALSQSDTFDKENANMTEAYESLTKALLEYDDYLKELAEQGKLTDITFMLVNPDFSNGSIGWSGTSFTQASAGVAEHYNKKFDFYQELSGLTAGVYKMSVQCFYRAGSSSAAYASHQAGTEVINPVIYMNGESKTVCSLYSSDKYTYSPYTYADNVNQANSAFNTDNQYNNELQCTVTDGTLKIGMRSTNSINADWCCFDNFRLSYLGDPSGVKDITYTATGNNKIYDLQGRLLSVKPQKGIYIKNNRKYVK